MTSADDPYDRYIESMRSEGLLDEGDRATGTPMVERSGVWVAFYADRSGAATFPTEIEALQYAVAMNADVQFVKWGEDVFTKDTRV